MNGIIFKVALDFPISSKPFVAMYGDAILRDDFGTWNTAPDTVTNIAAMKVASNELKALDALWSLHIPGNQSYMLLPVCAYHLHCFLSEVCVHRYLLTSHVGD